MRLFASICCPMLSAARARRRAGRGHSADCLPSLREGALRCSACWPVAELTSLAALSAFKQAATSQFTKRADARGQQACASRQRTRRCARTPPTALRATVLVFDEPHATTGSATGHPGRAQRAFEAPRSAGFGASKQSPFCNQPSGVAWHGIRLQAKSPTTLIAALSFSHQGETFDEHGSL